MDIEVIESGKRGRFGIEGLEQGTVFLWCGIGFIVTVDGGAVSLINGHLNPKTFFDDEQVEVIPDDDVTLRITR